MFKRNKKTSSGFNPWRSSKGAAFVELTVAIPIILAVVVTALEFSTWLSYYQKLNFVGREALSYTVRRCINGENNLSSSDWQTKCFAGPTVDGLGNAVPAAQVWRRVNNFVMDPVMELSDAADPNDNRFSMRILVSVWIRGAGSTPGNPVLTKVVSACIKPNSNNGGPCTGITTKVSGLEADLKAMVDAQEVVALVEVFSQYESIIGLDHLNWALRLEGSQNYYKIFG